MNIWLAKPGKLVPVAVNLSAMQVGSWGDGGASMRTASIGSCVVGQVLIGFGPH